MTGHFRSRPIESCSLSHKGLTYRLHRSKAGPTWFHVGLFLLLLSLLLSHHLSFPSARIISLLLLVDRVGVASCGFLGTFQEYTDDSFAIMNHLVASFLVLAQQTGSPGGTGNLSFILPFIVIGVLFYFMMVRPERRSRAKLEATLDKLKKNDRVVTVGGILGTVVQAPKGSEDITLKIDESSGTRLRILRKSISRVVDAENGSASTK